MLGVSDAGHSRVQSAKSFEQGLVLVVFGRFGQASLDALAEPAAGLTEFHPAELLAAGSDEVHRRGAQQILPLGRSRIHETNQPTTDAFLDRPDPSVTGQGRTKLSPGSSGNRCHGSLSVSDANTETKAFAVAG